eukprot:Platyproteum_vivax@DN12857_c0_g1_i1.p1
MDNDLNKQESFRASSTEDIQKDEENGVTECIVSADPPLLQPHSSSALLELEADSSGVIEAASSLENLPLPHRPKCLKALQQILNNVLGSDDEKYRVLKMENEALRSRVLTFDEGLRVLLVCGFVVVDDLLVLPQSENLLGPIWLALSIISEMRAQE